ncbi:sporulation protein [Candidatus Bipolaricaulota bacterium]|nr:sporulation protein [Candidatus Bipolaricaulota bacterium]
MKVDEMIEQLADDLKSYASTSSIFGEPIELQGATVIPVSKMSVGYGGGGGEGEEGSSGDKGGGGGAGGGVKIEPAALIIAKGGEVSVVSIKARESKFDSLIEMIPEAVEKFSGKQSGKEGEEAEKVNDENREE